MKKYISWIIPLVIVGLAICPTSLAHAQEKAKPTEEAKAVLAEAQKLAARPVYHLVFVVREMDGDKVINSRTYSLSVLDHDRGKVRAGSNIPYKLGENQFGTMQVGINIDCSVQERQNGVLLNAKFELPGVAPPENMSEKSPRPILRNLSLEEQPEVPLGKPTIIGKLDDVGTNHTFEFEVTATKVK